MTIDEFLNFASNAFHNIQNIDSVGLLQYAADDGPNGSDSHYLTEGSYQGTPYADAADYDYGTRVGPTPENIAYSWNKELAYRVGEITLGESTLVLNLPIMIGPGMNIHRHGYTPAAQSITPRTPSCPVTPVPLWCRALRARAPWSTSSTPPSTIRRSTAPVSQSL